jgi:methylenetetrahydrofolate dehydrogenase (NADP+) / methenyltetrahydrofolate cyclohydrolase
MKIDGRVIAENIYADLRDRVGELQQKGVQPTLAVILIGDDPGSVSYVHQKEKHTKLIGAELRLDRISTDISSEDVDALIQKYNHDPQVHGIIVQRPCPKQISKDFLDHAVLPEKDVDGFHPESDFAAPVALAVERVLYEVYKEKFGQHSGFTVSFDSFIDWLIAQDMVVLGKGETAGQPIINHFHDRHARLMIIDSKTEQPEDIIGGADIIISAVGKKNVLTPNMVNKHATLIGVGLHTEEGKLRGDFTETEMAEKVAFYTPTPGGVGPVNVAMLLANVIRAAEERMGTV